MPSPENVTVAILPAPDARANGAGWLLPDGDVVTCAHVVAGLTKVWVRTCGSDAGLHDYYVDVASQPRQDAPGNPFQGDLALLKPVDGTRKAKPGREYRPRPPRYGEEAVSFGFPADYPAGLSGYGRVGTGSSVGRYELLESGRKEHILTRGFSGAPLVSAERPNVIGLFATTVEEKGRGYLIPPRFIRDWLEEIGASKDFLPSGSAWPPPPIKAITRAVFGGNPPDLALDVRVRQMAVGAKLPEELARILGQYEAEDLTPEQFVSQLDAEEVPVLVRAGGGGGKSTFLVEVAIQLEEAEIPYLWLDLKKLKSGDEGQALTELLDDYASQPGELITRLCTPACEVSGWGEKLNAKGPLVIIADGINEVGKEAARLLQALEAHWRFRNDTRLVATARTTTELKPRQETRQFIVTPLPDTVIRGVTGQAVTDWSPHLRALLSNPQMLGFAVATQSFGDVPRSEMFERYFSSVLEKVRQAKPNTWLAEASTDFLLAVLARLAFDLLHNAGAVLTISENEWNVRLDQALNHPIALRRSETWPWSKYPPEPSLLTAELIELGVLTRTTGLGPPMIGFQHPLYQEWLAARYFVALRYNAWTNAGFTAITLEDSSDDALRLALDLVAGRFRHLFLQHMYDWRWQRVMALLAEKVEGVASTMRDAFIGLNALRLLDPFKHTREAVQKPLQRLADGGDEFASSLLKAAEAGSEPELWRLVKERFADVVVDDPELILWKDLFGIAAPVNTDHLSIIVVPYAFTGWSAASVFRRLGLSLEAAEAALLAYTASLGSTMSVTAEELPPGFELNEIGVGVRWRIVHMLGRGVPAEFLTHTVQFLLDTWGTDIEHRDVRFGACRSLMKIALDAPDRREAIFGGMIQMLGDWREDARPERRWRDSAYKAAEELWRGWEPADGVLEPADMEDWRLAMRQVLAAVKQTATALEWRTEALDATIAMLQEEPGR
jgi:hypothetical protein